MWRGCRPCPLSRSAPAFVSSRTPPAWVTDRSPGSRRVVGRSLATPAHRGAAHQRRDHGMQFGFRAFTECTWATGPPPSMGSSETASTMQRWSPPSVNDSRSNCAAQNHWRTRPELPTALFAYLEILHNRRREHPPWAASVRRSTNSAVLTARNQLSRLHKTQGTSESLPNPGLFT